MRIPQNVARNIESWSWLPLDRWTPEEIMTNYAVAGNHMCQVCDTFIPQAEELVHVQQHVEEARHLAAEARRRRAEERAAAAAV